MTATTTLLIRVDVSQAIKTLDVIAKHAKACAEELRAINPAPELDEISDERTIP